MNNNQDVFELVKNQNINIKDYLSEYYNMEWKGTNNPKTCCPFHGDSEDKPNLGYNKKTNTVKCFVCDAKGDLINFVVKKEGFENREHPKVDACKMILDKLGISYLRTSDVKELTPEEREALEKKAKEQQEQREKKQAEKQKQLEADQEKATKKMNLDAPTFSKYFQDNFFEDKNISEILDTAFVKVPDESGNSILSKTLIEWSSLYLGYDNKVHNSFCILNRDKENTYNIKHRTKYQWDADKKEYLSIRNEGKWISTFNSKIFPFPYEYFKTFENDEPVIICEGEKDALNLLSYGINVLTLGGVSNPWEEYAYLLKDRKVYIWFDHDNAGYRDCVKRFHEISKVTNQCYVTLFYDINAAYEKNYDISDYLMDKKFKSKEDIFHSIAYASYKLTTSKIEDIEEYTDLDLKEFYFNQPIKTFLDIKKEWVRTNVHGEGINVFTVKGQKDIKGLGEFYEAFKATKQDKGFAEAKKEILQETLPKFAEEKEKDIDDLINMFDGMFKQYDSLHKHYSQTHLYDMVDAFEAMCKHTDNTFGKFNSKLYVWTGTHYQDIDAEEDNFDGFLLKRWMPLSYVDKKKQLEDNVTKMIKNIYMGADNLSGIKKLQKNKRVLNFENGTLFITNKGRVTFKNYHTKKDAATNILEFPFEKNATCPKFDKFLDRILPNKDDQQTLLEYIGYCFLPSHDYEAFIILYGKSGSNGKSVIIDIVKSFFGKENVSNLQLQDFEGHQLHSLNNKIINMGSEIDTKNMNKGQIQKLKNIVSPEDSLEINPKMRDPYEMDSKSKPKLWFAVNDKPTTGVDAAFFRRNLFLNFNIQIGDDEKIRGLSKRFDDEKSGILNKSLKALNVLIKNGRFTKSDNMIKDLEAYKDEVSPLRRYVKDCLELDAENMIPKQYLYQHYKEYSEEKGNHALAQAKFFTKLNEEMGVELETSQLRVNIDNMPDRPRFLQGVYCNKTDITSITFEKQDIPTEQINFSIKEKSINVKMEDMKD